VFVQVEARSVAEAYYAALAAIDLDGVAATLAPDVHAEAPGVTFEERGPLLAWMRGFFDAFPGIEHIVDRLEVAGGRAEADLRVIGTHTAALVGPEGSIPPTGRRMELHARNDMQIADGTIRSVRIEFDPGDLMRQLGLSP
jgi:predicted ester cyclase